MRNEDMGAWVATRLRELREAQGLSLRGLARRAGVTTEMVSRAEKNSKTPSVNTLARLCQGLGVSLAEFFGGEGARKPAKVEGGLALTGVDERAHGTQMTSGIAK
jgi:transcriptional regulator with XRE-family HTH domain